MSLLRRFTTAGVHAFSDYLSALSEDHAARRPDAILSDEAMSEAVPGACELPPGPFETRWDFARSLFAAFETVAISEVDRDSSIWSWLACYYFDQICPVDEGGLRDPGERPLYLLEPQNWKRYYRHLVAGPFRVYKANRDSPERCRALLLGAPDTPGELYEQIAAQQLLVSSKSFVELVGRLYLDSATGKLKRGAGGKAGGSPRRLTQISKQFDLTYDLATLGPSEVMRLLPKEFNRFKQ